MAGESMAELNDLLRKIEQGGAPPADPPSASAPIEGEPQPPHRRDGAHEVVTTPVYDGSGALAYKVLPPFDYGRVRVLTCGALDVEEVFHGLPLRARCSVRLRYWFRLTCLALAGQYFGRSDAEKASTRAWWFACYVSSWASPLPTPPRRPSPSGCSSSEQF